jgi:pyruvate-ferredoxin/flavodoxin oxidoreductase
MKVSEFDPSGTVPNGTTQYEKRGIGLSVPIWDAQKCIQCGQCTLVCPHAVIRSFLVSDAEMQKKPSEMASKAAIGVSGSQFVIQCSPLDCTGCASCVNVCPAKEKALSMKEIRSVVEQQEKN